MKRLKLIAFDAEDLGIIAAHVQDAVLHVSDLDYKPAEKRFFLEINRFVWENEVDGKPREKHERRKSVLHFERVHSVQIQGIDRKLSNKVLSVLTILPVENEAENADEIIEIVFAGGATLRLTVECIEAQLTDMAAAWETPSRPDHDGEAG